MGQTIRDGYKSDKKIPTKFVGEVLQIRITGREVQQKQPTIRPTEYRCYIKEVNPI